jgi:hypothetical protein
MEMADSGRNAVPVRHVDEIDELLAVVLDVKIEEFYQKAMDGKDVGAYRYLGVVGVGNSNVTFLLDDASLNHILHPVGLLELYVKIGKYL